MEDLIYILSWGAGAGLALLIYCGLQWLYHKGWMDGFEKGRGK